MQNNKTVTIIITDELYDAAINVANGGFIKLALEIFNLNLNKISIHIDPTSYNVVHDKNIGDEVNITLAIMDGFHIVKITNKDTMTPSTTNRGVKDESK